jgi:glutamate--cysteine ligase regulatory subunit
MISSQQATARSFDIGESSNSRNEKGDSLTTTINHNDVKFVPVFPKACTLLLNSGNIVTCDRLTRKSGRKAVGASDTNETTTVSTGPQTDSEIEVTDMINNTIGGWLQSPERQSTSIEEAKEVRIRHPGLYCKCESTNARMEKDSSVVTKDEVSTSVKLFLNSFDPECLRDSIKQILSETGVDRIETLIVSFPDKIFNQDHLPSELLLPLWKCVNEFVQREVVHHAGLADFNFSYLEEFFKLIDETNASLKEAKQKDENNNDTSEVAVDQDHQEICKPVINQVPLQTVCKMPENLVQFAKANKMQLTTHSDSIDILNVNTLQQCIKKQMHEYDARGWVHTWLARYTLVLKCRGIVSSKGYILNAHRDLKYTANDA